MRVYADTALVVAALASEPATETAQRFLAATSIATSGWVDVEVVSALALKRRAGIHSADDMGRSLTVWQAMRRQFERLAIEPSHYDRAARLVERSTTGLRGADALHAAIAEAAGLPLATLDHGLLRACAEYGISSIDPLAG